LTYQYPLLWGVIAAYSVSMALVIWSFLFQRSSNKLPEIQREISPLLRKVMLACIILAIIGTVLLLMQLEWGAFNIV